MVLQELIDLELNTVVKYGLFLSVQYKGKDEKHVLLQDRNGDQKRVYIDLFLKNATVIK